MRAIKRALFNRWMLALLGAVLLCLLIWFGGPLIGVGSTHPLDSEIVRVIVMAAVIVLIVILLLIGSLRARRKDEKLIEGVAGAAPAKDDKAQAIDAQRLAQRNQLTQALGDMRKARSASGGDHLYEFPWYVIIGPPGAGKTTALLNSGLRFPLAERHGAQALKGVGGTRNCDWWFTEKAVIIDTAGRYTTQDSDATIDQAGWRNFLGLLKETRSSQPLNGVFVVFGVPDLVGLGVEDRRSHARAVRARLIELQDSFGLSLPVYVVFTKLDMIAGFTEYFDDLDREGREQVLGITFPLPKGGSRPQAGFGDAFDRLLTRLKTRLLDRLQGERDLARRNLIFGFPAQFASLRAIVDELLTEAADESRFASPLMVRGVYFTSATQQGQPIDRLMGVLAARFGVSQQALPAQVGTGRGFFLQRLFDTVVFGEAGLVGANASVVRRRKLVRRAAFAGIAAATLAICGLWTWAYLDNRALINAVSAEVTRLQPLMTAAAALPYGNGDLRPVLPLLNDIRNLPTGFADQARGGTVAQGFGLYQGERLGVQTQAIYQRALRALLLPRLIVRAQTRLDGQLNQADLGVTFRNLKAYLMLGSPGNLEPAYLRDWVNEDQAALQEPERVAVAEHLAALLADEDRWDEVALDAPLIAEARARIARQSPAQRVLSSLQSTPRVPVFRVIDNAGQGQASEVLQRGTTRLPLTSGVPGIYTVECYYAFVVQPTGMANLLRVASNEAWVYGEAQQSQPLTLRNEVLDLYAQTYMEQWDALISDLAFPQLSDAEQGQRVLRIISTESNSPFVKLMRAMAREVQLTVPPGAPNTPQAAVPGFANTLLGSPCAAAANPAALAQLSQRAGQIGAQIGQVTATGLQLAEGQDIRARTVEDHFRWLIEFVGVDSQSPMSDYLAKLRDLAQRMTDAITDRSGATSFAAVAARVAVETNALPQQIRSMARNFAASAVDFGTGVDRQRLAEGWEPILRDCQALTRSRYPFSRGATNEVPLDDLARLFGPSSNPAQPHGIDGFFQTRLKDSVNTTQRPWRLNRTDLAITQAAVDQFMYAADIRDAFFPQGERPGLAFDVTALSAGDARQTVLEIDGQALTIEPPNFPTAAMQWPLTGAGARIVGDGTEIVKVVGSWGFLRLFDQGSPGRLSDDRWSVNLGGARFQFKARSVRNPFSLRRSLDQFRCTALF